MNITYLGTTYHVETEAEVMAFCRFIRRTSKRWLRRMAKKAA